jgi:hypothetical protein
MNEHCIVRYAEPIYGADIKMDPTVEIEHRDRRETFSGLPCQALDRLGAEGWDVASHALVANRNNTVACASVVLTRPRPTESEPENADE